jgi:hypothetical protein
MKKALGFLSVLALLVGTQAHALKKAAAKTSTPAPVASDSEVERKNVISPSIGFMGPGSNTMKDTIGGTESSTSLKMSGLLGIGFDYEYMLKDDFSVGGILRYYQTTDSIAGTKYTDSAFVIGPIVHAYLVNSSHWLGYVGSGFVVMSLKEKQSAGGADQTYSPDMAVGLPIVMGVAYKINDLMSAGIEHTQVMALGSDINGWPISDFMLRLRLALAN